MHPATDNGADLRKRGLVCVAAGAMARPSRFPGAARSSQYGGMAVSAEQARHWRYAELPGVDLLRARYIRRTFVRHTHEHYVIAAIAEGVDVFRHTGADRHAGPGILALVNPDTPHTGRAGGPEGWRYGVVYPAPEVVVAIAAETTTLRGSPGFIRPVLDDPYAVELVHRVLRAAEEGNALAADTLLRVAVTRLLRRNGGPLPRRTVRTAGATIAARARASCRRASWTRRALNGSPPDSAPVRSLSCAPSVTRTACLRTRGSPNARCAGPAAFSTRARRPPPRPPPWDSPTSRTSTGTSPGSWGCRRGRISASARTYKTRPRPRS